MPARSGIYTAQFVGNDAWDAAVSLQTIGLDVKYRVTITRPKTNVKLNSSVKFKGSVAPVDFASGTLVQIQRKKGSGAWKNWVKVGAGEQRRVLDQQEDEGHRDLPVPRRLRRRCRPSGRHQQHGQGRRSSASQTTTIGRGPALRTERTREGGPARGRPSSRRRPRRRARAARQSQLLRRRDGVAPLISLTRRCAGSRLTTVDASESAAETAKLLPNPTQSLVRQVDCRRARCARTWGNADSHPLSPVVVLRRSTPGSGGR